MNEVVESTRDPVLPQDGHTAAIPVWRRPVSTSDVWWGTIWLVRLTLAVVLILAAASKLVNPEPMANTLKADHVPERLIPAATVMIAGVEIFVAAALIVAGSGTRPLFLPAILFIVFAVQLAYLKSQNIQSCNCFSGLIQYESSNAALRFQIIADLAIAVLCAALGFWNPSMAKGGSDGSARPHSA